MQVTLDNVNTDEIIAKTIASLRNEFIKEFGTSLNSMYKSDELLTKKELCKQILKCDPKTFDDEPKYRTLPFIQEKSRKRYSRKAVDKWIEQNQKTLI